MMNKDLNNRICVIVLLISLICHFPSLLAAEDIPELKVGDRLRIKTGTHSAVYILDSIDSDGLNLHRDGGIMPDRIKLEDIKSMEVDAGPSYGKSVSKYGGGGFIVGAGIGVIFGYSLGDDPPCTGQEFCTGYSAEDKAVMWGVVFGLSGALVGGLIGNANPITDWKPIDVEGLPASLSMDCDHRGIFLSYGF